MELEQMIEEYRSDYRSYKDFTGLVCWRDCRDVKLFFYSKIIPLIPRDEHRNIGFQIRKSARSTTANIAEGTGRFNYQEGIQYLRITRGSLYELKDDLIFCMDLGLVSEPVFHEGLTKIEKAKASTNGFIKYLNNKKKNSK